MRFVFLAVLLHGVASVYGARTNFFENCEKGLGTEWSVGDANPAGTRAHWSVVGRTFGNEAPHSGTRKLYCAGVGRAGTVASPKYRDEMEAYLQRTVDLTGYSNAILSFWFKMPGIEPYFDTASVYMDGAPLWTHSAAVKPWTKVTLPLTDFVGAPHTLKFEFKSDSNGVFEGCYLDDILVVSGPFNDSFTNAVVLSGGAGSVTNHNSDATAEPLEPNAVNSVWFRWTPWTNGVVTFGTAGSSFDTVLCVYTGAKLGALTNIACDDNSNTNFTSRVSFNAVAGTTYSISVRGASSAKGVVVLNWDQPNGEGHDLLPDLTVWADEGRKYLYGWFLDRNEISGRVLLRIATATPNIGAGKLEMRGSSTTPGVYQRIHRDDGTWWDRHAGTFTFHPGHLHLHYDNWMNFRLRTALTNDDVGDIVVTGDKTSFAIIDLIQYDESLPGAPTSPQFTGGLVQGLSVGWADVYGANLTDQWIDVTDISPGRYWLEAVVDPANNILESNESNNFTRILIEVGSLTNAVENDFFTNALALNGLTTAVNRSNNGATREPGEPRHANNDGGASMWFTWVAPASMLATISTEGSDFDTLLAVYRGTTISNLLLIASNDDVPGVSWSRVTFDAISNVTYQIALDGFNGAFGAYQLAINPAWNDSFAGGIVVTGASGTVSASSRGASRESGEPNHAGLRGSNSIWFTWTAPVSGAAIFQTIGSSFDTLLAIYTGTSVSNLTVVGADNDSAGAGASRVTFNCTKGTMYRIAVDGVNGGKGVVRLNWAGPTPPVILAQPLSTNVSAGSAVTFGVTNIGSAPMFYQWRHQATNLVNDTYHAGANSPLLTLKKAKPGDSGGYSVVITNAYGATTSAPGNLIVIDNPRVVFVSEISGHSGAFVRVPVQMQCIGNEHVVSFTLLYDPTVLSIPRVSKVPAGATFGTNNNNLGALGLSVTLASNAVFAAGDALVVEVTFDSVVAGDVSTFAGFGTRPTPRVVLGTNGVALAALFVAGEIDLSPLRVAQGMFTNGNFRFGFNAEPGERYAIDVSENLAQWTPLVTNTAAGASFSFSNTTAEPRRFYRVRLLP